jgi:hypothetical protein
MRNHSLPRAFLTALILATSLSTFDQARALGFYNDRVTGDPFLVTVGSVQRELRLTDEQIGKAAAIARERPERGEELRSRYRETPLQERDKRYEQILAGLRALDDVANKSLTEFLSAEQMKRYKQIVLQGRGFAALGESWVQRALGMTEDQRTRIDQLVERGHQETPRISERVSELPKTVKASKTFRETIIALQGEPEVQRQPSLCSTARISGNT